MKSYLAPFALLIGSLLLAAGLAVLIQPGQSNSYFVATGPIGVSKDL